MSDASRAAVGMPVPGARVALATPVGPAEARVVESVESDVVVLSDSSGLHVGASVSTRLYDGERVWNLTFRVRARHELMPGQARIELTLSERLLLGEERALPRAACDLAATSRRAGEAAASSWARVLDISQSGLKLRSDAPYVVGDLIDIGLDDGTGAVINARLELVHVEASDDGRIARGRIVAVADGGAHRLEALVDRLRALPSDGGPQPEPLPALREALAAARRHNL